jgi:hypothetical protein
MPYRHLGTSIFAVPAALAFVACSDQSPVAPGATADGAQYATTLAQPAEGQTYLFTVYATPVGRGAVLDAYVEDASGNPATSGTAFFQYCALQQVPAPSAECDSGSGHWVFWVRAGIIHTDPPGPNEGHALAVYDLAPPSGTTIGFRFRYLGQGSGIANETSNSADYTWP